MSKILILIFVLFSSCIASQSKQPCQIADKILSVDVENLPQGSSKSQKLLDSAIALCPLNPNLWYEKGVPYVKRGDFATWKIYIDKAVELWPDYYLGIRGWCTWKFLKDYEGAYQDFLRSETINRNVNLTAGDLHITTWLGICKNYFGQYDSALYYFDKSIDSTIAKQGINYVGLYDYLFRGITKMYLKRYHSALSDFDKQIKAHERIADAYYYKGLTLMKIGKRKDALKELTTALRLFQNDGYHNSDPYCEMPYEIYASDIKDGIFKASQ